jgi:hypothetical protein
MPLLPVRCAAPLPGLRGHCLITCGPHLCWCRACDWADRGCRELLLLLLLSLMLLAGLKTRAAPTSAHPVPSHPRCTPSDKATRSRPERRTCSITTKPTHKTRLGTGARCPLQHCCHPLQYRSRHPCGALTCTLPVHLPPCCSTCFATPVFSPSWCQAGSAAGVPQDWHPSPTAETNWELGKGSPKHCQGS